MNLFDSLTHTFGTLATGGFSNKNSSVGHYDSPFIDCVITLFMILAGVNFALHYRVLTGNIKSFFHDTEFKAYLCLFLISTGIITFILYDTVSTSVFQCLRLSGFQVASILTTTGYVTTDFEQWPSLARMSLFILMFVGGCAGSTGGGIKVIRIVTLMKRALNEMKLLIHPRGVFTLKISETTIRKNIAYAISGFFFLYVTILLAISFVVSLSGQDIVTSVSTALATLGNIGPGFGNVGPTDNYAFFPDYVKWTLSFAMLVGGLELYTVLVLFTPSFWRK